MTNAEERDYGLQAALFLIPLVTYAYFYQGSDHSVACRFDLMRSILEHGKFWIDNYSGYNTADIIKFRGHIYSVKAPGTSYTALVPWILIRFLLTPLHTQARHDIYWAMATYLTTVATTSVIVSAMCVVMYRFARFLGATPGRAAGLALVLGFGTIAFPYATELTGEPVAGFCLFTSFYLLATFDADSSWQRAFWAGILAGWAVVNDYPSFLVAAALGIYAIYRLYRVAHTASGVDPTRTNSTYWLNLASFSIGAGITAIIMLQYNWGAFGSPWFFSYQAFKLAGNNQFPEQKQGFVGLTYPKLSNLWNILIDPQRGLLFCNPVLILSLLGAGYFARAKRWRPECIVTIYAFVALILFNASYGESIVSWGGGTATGPRQIVAAVPFMVLTLAFLPAALDYLAGALGALSAAIMLMATATNPHFPYEYFNPVRDFALQQFMHADFGANRDAFFGGSMIAGGIHAANDSIAFNLGKLAGLPPPIQLWPLALVWCFGLFSIAEPLELWSDDGGGAMRAAASAIAIAAIFLLSSAQAVAEPTLVSRPHGLLGRYYLGPDCGRTRTHVVRVDPEIDLFDVAEMGAMMTPSCADWTGALIAPSTGDYKFILDVDDTGWLTIDGHEVIGDTGMRPRYHAEGSVHLTAGPHRIEVGERNTGGDASIHLKWQPPGRNEEIIPASALVPARVRRSA
ncbi:MAG: PA14 domain-containing protein [Candidatus Binataceae bacterium]